MAVVFKGCGTAVGASSTTIAHDDITNAGDGRLPERSGTMGVELSNDSKQAARQKAERLCEVAGQLHAKANAYGKAG